MLLLLTMTTLPPIMMQLLQLMPQLGGARSGSWSPATR
jgi:hypothetical protein